MRTLYIECNMGAAGDMLMAALSELLPDPDRFIARMNALDLPGVRFERKKAEKCGITGTHISVTVDGEEEHAEDVDNGESDGHGHSHDVEGIGNREQGPGNRDQGTGIAHERPHSHEHHHDHEHDHDHRHHHHSSLRDIHAVIDGLELPEAVKADAKAVYMRIAGAESEVHGHPVDQIHFHEVGALDAVADVVGVCALKREIAPERVVVSPVHVGSGQVRCAHGVLPVPAPATALLLKGVPVYGGAIRGELCTPTGAALLTHFADGFGVMPAMTLDRVGYGMGTKDFPWANCVRVLLGETQETPDSAVELRCNLDDMTGEAIGFAVRRLREAGALDVWIQAIQMKKDRPGTLLCCLCPPEREAEFARLMLKHTTTIGVRGQTLRRYTLQREAVTLDTPYGPVRAKRSHGYGVDRTKPEFDDLAQIAEREGIAVGEINF
ncbi:MAG: nickel pincer cofactor biosynthesis protein LarC [Clostridia bacterium]|nr:nickel pincer cofactor biosynthesis protein LarC [Clostridia bacterium]